jgi:hypothetical protein
MVMSWTDTISDGLLVREQRKDPIHGSQDLQVFSYIFLALGGVVPNAAAIVFSIEIDLSFCYVVPAFIGLMIFGAGCNLSYASDAEDKKFMALSFREKLNFNRRALA